MELLENHHIDLIILDIMTVSYTHLKEIYRKKWI